MRFRLLITGVVQGVGFRAFTKRIAQSYGLDGWVRNLPDGRVEAVVEGDQEVIAHFVKDLWKGPPLSRVDKIEMIREESDEPLRGCDIRY